MLTSVKLSNISYNTEEFLQRQLNSLLSSKKISFWCYIKHQKEDEELKDHIHLLMFPDTRLDTSDLDDFFKEPIEGNLPLDCKLWTPCKSVYDWLLYGVHDSTYLKLKYAEDKKIHYLSDDFVTSDELILSDLIFKAYHEFDFWKSTKYQKFINEGLTCKDMIVNGYVEFKDMTNFIAFAKVLNDQ